MSLEEDDDFLKLCTRTVTSVAESQNRPKKDRLCALQFYMGPAFHFDGYGDPFLNFFYSFEFFKVSICFQCHLFVIC